MDRRRVFEEEDESESRERYKREEHAMSPLVTSPKRPPKLFLPVFCPLLPISQCHCPIPNLPGKIRFQHIIPISVVVSNYTYQTVSAIIIVSHDFQWLFSFFGSDVLFFFSPRDLYLLAMPRRSPVPSFCPISVQDVKNVSKL